MKISTRELADMLYCLEYFYAAEKNRAMACQLHKQASEMEALEESAHQFAESLYNSKTNIYTENL